MDEAAHYGQMDFNLPHDVIKLPSKGRFYRPKKESIKVGFLTANDENILMSQNNRDGIVKTLLREKIYEPGFNIDQMLDCDIQAVLIFLRNTAFGPEYEFKLTDPRTLKDFDATILIDEVDYLEPKFLPDDNGYFEFLLPKSNKKVKIKLLSIGEQQQVDKIAENYPPGMVAPVITKKLETQIVELEGNSDKGKIAKFVSQMPISDSKDLRKFITECEPKLDLDRKVMAPSGEMVDVKIAFGVEFFRPFF
jgi:hypothetical protein